MKLQSLEGLKVVDLTTGMAGAVSAKLLADMGCDVSRLVTVGHDPFDAIYPAHRFWRDGLRRVDAAGLDALLASADICLVGGEDHPDLPPRPDAASLRARFPRLVVAVIDGWLDPADRSPATDSLVQARTGLAGEQLPDRPVRFSMALPSYGAALLQHIGLWTALIDRERTGKGCLVRTSLEQGTALFWSQIWMEASRPDATFDKLPPKGVEHLIFECAEGDHIHFVMGVPGAVATVYRILGIDQEVDPKDRGTPSLARGLKGYFADKAVLEPAIKRWKRQELLEAFWAAGLPAEPVLRPGEFWDDAQIAAIDGLARDSEGRRGVALPFTLAPAGEGAPGVPVGGGRQGPLSGLTILDLGNFIAGPFASKHLADYGADVIKVEPPDGLANLTGLRNVWVSNRGKRSICIDLKSPAGAGLVERLCARADAVHHNFRLGVAERLNLDPACLRKTNPSLVTLQTRAYGAKGPRARRPGFDMVMQALCGHEYRAGGQGNKPMWYRSALIDFATGTLGAIALLAGLYEKMRSGRGVDVETSLLNGALFMMSELVEEADGHRHGAPVLNADRTGFHPAEQIYAAADGWIALCARTDAMAARLADALEVAAPARADWGQEVADAIAARAQTFATSALLDRLRAADVWCEPCTGNAWERLRTDPQARARHMVISAPDATYGEVTSTFGPLVSLSSWTPETFRSAPAGGEHTREILAGLGCAPDEIETLFKDGAVA
ncbi:CoA transferase [Niveispirillum sp. KHB5.9]|uniref:CoA transferase n=1 Tax=Niveispirillum sp. KHB5.9 TaxID=3400269 RepID=UPI003A839B9E